LFAFSALKNHASNLVYAKLNPAQLAEVLLNWKSAHLESAVVGPGVGGELDDGSVDESADNEVPVFLDAVERL